MLITLKNKEFLILNDFIFKCAIGKNGIKLKKKEGDKATPSGKFSIGKLYYRADKVKKPLTKIPSKIIKSNMGWCDDPKNFNYNNNKPFLSFITRGFGKSITTRDKHK